MRVVVQRVKESSVHVNGNLISSIENGLLVLVGFVAKDVMDDLSWMSKKIANLRIFDDENGIMNKSLLEVDGELLIVSQFTLHAKTKKGNRPSYIEAAKADISIPLYEDFLKIMTTEINKEVKAGQFGADMKVSLINDGPVTIIMDSKNKE